MVVGTSSMLLDPPSMLEPVSSQLTALERYPSESEATLAMASSHTSTVRSVSCAPTPLAKPSQDIIKHGQNGLVKSGTLGGLIQELIDAKADRIEYKKTFLALYRSFATGEEVLRLLLERFETVSSSDVTDPSTDARLFIFQVLELWQDLDYIAAIDIPLLQQIRDFAASIQASSSFFRHAQRLVNCTDKTLGMFRSATPPLTISSSFLKPSDPAFENFSARDLADVLTSIEGDRFRKLRDLDYVHWLEGNHEPNAVSTFVVENRKLSYWVERSILRSQDQSQRAENLKLFLLTIKECIRLCNFSSACALSTGVTTKAITDLKRTYGDLDKKNRHCLHDAKELISIHNNFRSYRTIIKGCRNVCIPWLYVHLIHDLKVIHRKPIDRVDEDGHTNLINFERCRRLHHRIRQIRGYEPPGSQPTNPAHHARLRTVMDAELDSTIINHQHGDWAQKMGIKLAGEERMDYDAHKEELRRAGFIPQTSRDSVSPTRRPSSHLSRRTASTSMPSSPWNETQTHSPKVKGDSSVNNRPRLQDVFKRGSEQCLDGRIKRLTLHPTTGGGYADIWEGLLGDKKVAIKCIRCFSSVELPSLRKRLWQEYAAWTCVSHPIVLKCLGFTHDFSQGPYPLPSLISPWMSNGTLPMYLTSHPETDRLKILLDVAEGLSYLHAQNPVIIHGDIRGNNILISDSGAPCLSDFGLSKVLTLEGMTQTGEPGGSLRWMSPELLGDKGVPSRQSDVWAYAMTVLEIMSGRPPYTEVRNEAATMRMICQGQLPLRSLDYADRKDVPNDVWAICQKCWNIEAKQRPSMQEVFLELKILIDSRT